MEPMVAPDTSFRSQDAFTQAQFRAWMDRRPASDPWHYELLRGRIVMSPPARAIHGRVGAVVATAIETCVARSRRGLVFDASTGFELPSGDTVEPDVSFVSSDRWRQAGEPGLRGFLPVVPDLVVETLSPSSTTRDRVEKSAIYAANGVLEFWIVDPEARSVEVRSRRDGDWGEPVTSVAGRVASSLLPDLQLEVEDLFAGFARR
ncbi:MAG: Uma2 family endonuclease [Alphaproteobacteria bacterium]